MSPIDLDDVEGLRSQAYDIRDVLIQKADDNTGPRMNRFLPHLDQVIEHLDDWRIDLMDEDDELDKEEDET